jgi:hypothetical protein
VVVPAIAVVPAIVLEPAELVPPAPPALLPAAPAVPPAPPAGLLLSEEQATSTPATTVVKANARDDAFVKIISNQSSIEHHNMVHPRRGHDKATHSSLLGHPRSQSPRWQ